MSDQPELSPPEKDELHKLCDEYGVATNGLVKALRVVNPLEQVDRFLAEQQKVEGLTEKIKAILRLKQ